jgi:hypothetical protein
MLLPRFTTLLWLHCSNLHRPQYSGSWTERITTAIALSEDRDKNLILLHIGTWWLNGRQLSIRTCRHLQPFGILITDAQLYTSKLLTAKLSTLFYLF